MSLSIILFLIISLIMFFILIGSSALNTTHHYPDTVNRIISLIFLPICLITSYISQAVLRNTMISYMIFLTGIIFLYILLSSKLTVSKSINRFLGYLFMTINLFFFIMIVGTLNRAHKINTLEEAGYWNGFIVLPLAFFILLSIIAAMYILKIRMIRAALLFLIMGLLLALSGVYNIIHFLPYSQPGYQGEPLYDAGPPAHFALFSLVTLFITASLFLFYARRVIILKNK